MRHPRPRRVVSPVTMSMLRPLFRYSPTRDAYILRLIGKSAGPVLVERAPLRTRPPSATS